MTSRNRHEGNSGARDRLLSRERLGLPKELRPDQGRAVNPRPPRNKSGSQKQTENRSITEKPLYRSVTAPIVSGLQHLERGAAAIIERVPGARPLSLIQAMLLGQHEVLDTQVVANQAGEALKTVIDASVRAVFDQGSKPVGDALRLQNPIKIADPTDPNSERFFAAYPISKAAGSRSAESFARQRFRSGMESIAMRNGCSYGRLGTLAVREPFIPIAELTDPAAFDPKDYETSPRRLELGLITLGALVLHQAPGLPQFGALSVPESL
jgi:hypothetical protein